MSRKVDWELFDKIGCAAVVGGKLYIITPAKTETADGSVILHREGGGDEYPTLAAAMDVVEAKARR
jgi:hypothetical protein